MSFYEKMMSLDRRWIYLGVGIAVSVAVWIDFQVPVHVTGEVESVYDFVEDIKPGEILFLAIDYDPQAMAEVHPMARAIMRQCFSKGIKLIISALSQNGPGMAEQLIAEVSQEFNKKSGEDFVYLGYKPYFPLVILAMGQDMRIPFPEDYYGVSLDSLPMMDNVRNYNDVRCVIDISSGNITDYWIAYGVGRYHIPLAVGVTGVMAANYYPFLQSGQIFGLLAGLKGAAEYEVLSNQTGEAVRGMRVQTVAHSVIILFIVISNIAYFMSKKKKV